MTSDDVVYIGALLAQNGANAVSGVARINSLQLAVDEVNAAGGIPDPDRCKPARRLAFVACDDANLAGDGGAAAPDAAPPNAIDRVRAGKHLTADLGIPVIR